MRSARTILALIGCATSLIGLVACNSDGRTLRPAAPDQTASVYTTTTSSTVAPSALDAAAAIDPAVTTATLVSPELAFVLNLPWDDGGAIDSRYTCEGAGIQPGFSWLGAPAGAVEMALVVTDIDADNFVHWVIAGLDPNNPFVGEDIVPVGAIEGINDFGAAAGASATGASDAPSDDQLGFGWSGPCPPAGSTHRYVFDLYALSAYIELPSGSAAADLQAAIDATALSVTQRTGVFTGT